MNPLVHQFAQRRIDHALTRDAILAGKERAFNLQSEMALAAAIMTGMADMMIAFIDKHEGRGRQRVLEATGHFGGDRASGG